MSARLAYSNVLPRAGQQLIEASEIRPPAVDKPIVAEALRSARAQKAIEIAKTTPETDIDEAAQHYIGYLGQVAAAVERLPGDEGDVVA